MEKKFTSPILQIVRKDLATNVAFNLLNRRSNTLSESTQTLKRYGVPPGQIKDWVLQRELEKQERIDRTVEEG